MLREILRNNIDELLLSIDKIGRAFELVKEKTVDPADIREIKRLIHSLKGNLQAIGLHDEASDAIRLEEEVFRSLNGMQDQRVYIGKQTVDEWFSRLNAVEFSLKGYLF